jgi:enoyl-CoA hydratase/carnithine racemase
MTGGRPPEGAPGGARHVVTARDGTVATVTMDRPERRNALSVAHMRELTAALQAVGEDRSLGVVVLAGAGPAFCAGHDLGEIAGADEDGLREVFDVCVALMETVQSIPQPVIARVQGIATAAGCQLVATCDLAVAADDARFATPGVRIGLFCSTPMVALSRAVSPKRAMEMLLTGDPITAREALEAGLVNRVVPAARLQEETLALARRVAEGSRTVVGIGKRAFHEQLAMSQRDAYRYAAAVMVANALGPDAREGVCAFLEKRPPVWPEG